MKKYITRAIAIFILMALCLPSELACVQAAKKEKLNYVALGDSIAAGYGLKGYIDEFQAKAPKDSYQSQIAKKLGASVVNDAITGITSQELIDLLTSKACDKELKTADYVTISIGSNDILGPVIEILGDIFEVEDKEDILGGISEKMGQADFLTLVSYVKELGERFEDNKVLHEAASKFPKKLETILTLVKTKAPNAKIYMTNSYNPYVCLDSMVLPVGTYTQTYIDELNQAFTSDSKDYTLIDSCTLFEHGDCVNVTVDLMNPISSNLDPHPNLKGHKTLADAFYNAMSKDISETIRKVKIKSVTSKHANQITLDYKKQKDADGYTIYYSTKKNGTYKKLKSTTKEKLSISSKKLKADTKYYIYIKAYKKFGDEVIYGPESASKKVRIAVN